MVQDDKVEYGYLYLEQCEIFSKDCQAFPVSKWMDLIFQENSSENIDTIAPICPHCKLVVHSDEKSSSVLLWRAGRALRFEGTMQDIKPNRGLCECRRRRDQRTDAALVMGLALTSQDLGHVSIETARVSFHQHKHLDETVCTDDNRRLASLYVTLHIPEIKLTGAAGGRRFLSNSSKILPPSTQLLLSLLRSDWNFLKKIISQGSVSTVAPRKTPSARRNRVSLFPRKLSLDEVYTRIEGAACAMDETGPDSSKAACKDSMGLTALPKDLINYHIAVYLKAPSLDAFRRTCKLMHQTLRSVVPGLKLQLYTHQIESLSWMRNREINVIMENDLASYGHRRAHCREGDAHRAASGGASALLTARNDNRDNFHISQYNGDEILLRSDDLLSRAIARGGLLCDDPGLGKTITVVSLILQSLGLSTEPSAPSEESSDIDQDAGNKSAGDDQIFTEYWKESTIPEYRSQYLNKLLNGFQRSCHDAMFFVYPVDPISDGCPDYLQVIEDPISIQDIRQRIASNDYGDSFASFEADIEKLFR